MNWLTMLIGCIISSHVLVKWFNFKTSLIYLPPPRAPLDQTVTSSLDPSVIGISAALYPSKPISDNIFNAYLC